MNGPYVAQKYVMSLTHLSFLEVMMWGGRWAMMFFLSFRPPLIECSKWRQNFSTLSRKHSRKQTSHKLRLLNNLFTFDQERYFPFRHPTRSTNTVYFPKQLRSTVCRCAASSRRQGTTSKQHRQSSVLYFIGFTAI